MLYVNAKNSPNKVGNQTYGKYLYKIIEAKSKVKRPIP